MTDLEKIELAIRRAASQMPNHASRQFRLVADEIANVSVSQNVFNDTQSLKVWRAKSIHERD